MTTKYSSAATHNSAVECFSLDQWRLVSDQVMGGVSQGILEQVSHDGHPCNHLTGRVSTENNGGFINAGYDLSRDERFLASDATGIELTILGNNEDYNVHLRTTDLSLPWQSYRHGFTASGEWQVLRFPFAEFEPYRIDIPFNAKKLVRVSIAAIGRDFDADMYIARAGFY